MNTTDDEFKKRWPTLTNLMEGWSEDTIDPEENRKARTTGRYGKKKRDTQMV